MQEPPFRFGQVVSDQYFVGRAAEIASLTVDLRTATNVVLISPRRFGKTSLVLRVLRELEREGVLVAYVDLLRTPSKERFASHFAAAVYHGLLGRGAQALQQATEWFGQLRIRPKITLNEDGTPSFEFAGGAPSLDVDATIEHLLGIPQTVARERKRRVVMVFDEFQEVLDLDPALPGLMRSVFQEQGEVAHMFLGSRQHLLRKVFADRHQPLYRLARPMALGPIEDAAFAPYIRERFAAGRSQITLDGIEALLAITGGQPNDTQELAHFAWVRAVAEGTPATRETVQRALGEVVSAESARFIVVWDNLSPLQRRALSAAAHDDTRLYASEVRQRFQLGDPSGLQKALQRLSDLELIDTVQRGTYRVPDLFLRAWLRETSEPMPG
jgi:AAA+ ATPase superfamily predicted ATPase